MDFETYPAQITFCGRLLPYVKTGVHLGHTLAQDGSMNQDAKIRRAQYIDRTTDIRDTFHFAEPVQKLAAVDKYCGDHYGVVLYNLYDEPAEKYFRCWGTLVKLCWDLPRSTHKYFVPNMLSQGFSSIRTNMIIRYINFYRSLLKSRSKEVAIVARVAGNDKSSTTGINLAKIQAETGHNPAVTSLRVIRQALEEREDPVPPADLWRIPFLTKLINQRSDMELSCSNTNAINDLINNLCST